MQPYCPSSRHFAARDDPWHSAGKEAEDDEDRSETGPPETCQAACAEACGSSGHGLALSADHIAGGIHRDPEIRRDALPKEDAPSAGRSGCGSFVLIVGMRIHGMSASAGRAHYADVVKWQTRMVQVHVPKGVEVQVLSSAPVFCRETCIFGDVAKLVAALGLGPGVERRAGSNPVIPTRTPRGDPQTLPS